jgi:subtilase-type serine protease
VRLDAGDWRIEPSVTLAGVSLGQGNLTETQGGPVGMSVASTSVGSVQTLFGVRAERRFAINETMAVVPSAEVGWLHEYLDTQGTTTAAFISAPGVPFSVQSPSIGRDAAVLGVRGVLETGTPVSLYASYTGTLNGSSTAQTVAAGLRFVW